MQTVLLVSQYILQIGGALIVLLFIGVLIGVLVLVIRTNAALGSLMRTASQIGELFMLPFLYIKYFILSKNKKKK